MRSCQAPKFLPAEDAGDGLTREPPLRQSRDGGFFVNAESARFGRRKCGMIEAKAVTDENAGVEFG